MTSSGSHDISFKVHHILIFGKVRKMQFKIRGSILLLVVISALLVAQAKNTSLLISLPLHQSGPRTSWERGFEILPGALQAVNDINNDSTLLAGRVLKLIVVSSVGSDDTKIVQQFVNLTFHHMHPNDIIGVTGILGPETVSIFVPLVRHKGVLLSAITHTDQLDIPDYSGILFSLPSPFITVSTLLNFMNDMNWQRIGVVTDSADAYFFSVAEILLQVAKLNDSIIVSPYTELFDVTSAIQEIVKLNTRIIFVSLNAERAVQLLCTVYGRRLVWPEYAWIFHSFQVEHLLEQQSSCDDIKNAVNGIFFIDVQPQSDPSHAEMISGITSSNYYQQYFLSLSKTTFEYNATLTSRPNGYAMLLYDLVWTMAIALNESCHQLNDTCIYRNDSEATSAAEIPESHRDRNEWIFSIFHVSKLGPVLISTVHYSNNSVTAASFNASDSILENAPKGELPIMAPHPPLAYSIVVGLQMVLMTIFVTITLVLYVYFHKEPEIKATSFTLSLIMFLGCYLNLLYLSVLFYINHTLDSVNISCDNALCLSLHWLSGSGISLPLMLATLLVKMLRIYHIFFNTKLHLGRYCSDLALAFYVLLILVPDILVNLVWDIIDRYEVNLEYEVLDGNIYLEKTCRSNYQTPLIGALCVYLLILVIALAIVAIVTRKVRLQHFKDTKKVNVLVFIFSITIVISFSYWVLLDALGTERFIANLPLHIGHSVLIISFSSLLFASKVLPLLWRNVKNTSVRS